MFEEHQQSSDLEALAFRELPEVVVHITGQIDRFARPENFGSGPTVLVQRREERGGRGRQEGGLCAREDHQGAVGHRVADPQADERKRKQHDQRDEDEHALSITRTATPRWTRQTASDLRGT
ncbi:MAG: hypothetical protein JRH17_07770 [Deltaproteobacteria bacterium]|nr:hypothetical protein [Deltaproteobacteria bacterium]